MSKAIFLENLKELGIDNATFEALIELTPETIPFRDEMYEVLENVSPGDLKTFLEVENPTDLARAIKRLMES